MVVKSVPMTGSLPGQESRGKSRRGHKDAVVAPAGVGSGAQMCLCYNLRSISHCATAACDLRGSPSCLLAHQVHKNVSVIIRAQHLTAADLFSAPSFSQKITFGGSFFFSFFAALQFP